MLDELLRRIMQNGQGVPAPGQLPPFNPQGSPTRDPNPYQWEDEQGIDPANYEELGEPLSVSGQPVEPYYSGPPRAPLENKGLFGARGKLGSVLGTLGDAFLVQSGNKPVYSERMRGIRESNALEGFTNDPMGAVDRLSQIDPAAARELYNVVVDNETNSLAKKDLAADRQADNDVKTAGLLGSLFQSANSKTWPQIKLIAEKLAAKRGYELPFELPEEYDETLAQSIKYFGATPGQVLTDGYRGQRLEQIDKALEVKVSEGAANRGVRVSEGTANRTVRKSEGAANRGSRESVAGANRTSRERVAGNAPAASTKNKRGETVVYRRDGRVTTLRDSVDPRGNGKGPAKPNIKFVTGADGIRRRAN